MVDLIKKDIVAIEDELIALLGEWQETGKSQAGKRWPQNIKGNLREFVRVDGPAYGAGILELLGQSGPYTITGEEGAQIARLTAELLLKQVAGVSFVALRIFATKEIARLVNEAARNIIRKHDWVTSKP